MDDDRLVMRAVSIHPSVSSAAQRKRKREKKATALTMTSRILSLSSSSQHIQEEENFQGDDE
jgi:hypothetical protein